jgi:sugar phosphate isomerase/epimerase
MYVVSTMSITQSTDAHRAVSRCQPEDLTAVKLDAATIDSTAREYLRELKAELDREGYVPARLTVDVCLSEDCPFATQNEVDQLREYVRAASFLGATTVTASFDEVADESAARSALAACAERARRDGVHLELDGPVSLES